MRKKIGTVMVDAGIVMIGDPCYTLPDDGTFRGDTARDWGQFVDALYPRDDDGRDLPGDNYTPLGDGISVVVPSGYGDGVYPVYANLNDEGRVTSVTVEFI